MDSLICVIKKIKVFERQDVNGVPSQNFKECVQLRYSSGQRFSGNASSGVQFLYFYYFAVF